MYFPDCFEITYLAFIVVSIYFVSFSADPYVHLDKCTHFDQARLDQRFEVVNEIAASICSKFDQSMF